MAEQSKVNEDTTTSTSDQETPKPRRRGRPRKVAVAEPQAQADQASGTEGAERTEAPKPRRRGRPRKSLPAPAEAERPAALTAGQAADAAAPAAEKPRRRGRPRKVTKEAAGEAASTNAPGQSGDTSASAEGQLSIHEMTKTTQAATQAASQPMAAPAATLAEADAQQRQGASGAASQSQGENTGRHRRRNDGSSRQQQGFGQQGGQSGRRANQNRRRNRRNQSEQANEPSLSRDELQGMKVAELRSKAAELGVEYVGVRKKDLVESIYEAAALAEGFRPVTGVLEIQNEGYGFLRTGNYMSGDNDAFVQQQIIRQYGLRAGDKVVGSLAPSRAGNKYPPLHRIDTINGRPPEQMRNRPRFRDLTPIYPDVRLVMEHGQESITGRAIDLVAPIGKGQRGLIVSPPKAGKTTVLKRICQSIALNNPEVHLFCLLVDERPEEVTDMERSIRGEVVASTFDMPADNHTKVSELVIEHAKRLVEMGEDVVVVLDSITRLARAYNLAQPASGRILSGGVDSAALYPPKKFLGAARNIENGGSLTILASALVDTGSKMDEVIFEEFKGTGNMELKLDRDLADKRIFPAIDPVASGTRNEELLIEAELQPFVWGIRRLLANMSNTERAANALVKGLKGTKDNQEFLIRSARKAQQAEFV